MIELLIFYNVVSIFCLGLCMYRIAGTRPYPKWYPRLSIFCAAVNAILLITTLVVIK